MENTVLHIDCDKSGVRWISYCGEYDIPLGSPNNHNFTLKSTVRRFPTHPDPTKEYCKACIDRMEFVETMMVLEIL